MIVQQRDKNWWYKLNGAARYAIVRGANHPFAEPIILTEYPKSGGTWLSQMISHALDLPYPRNRLPLLGNQIIHGCYLRVHKDLDTLVVWRDGRDTIVSYYYHVMIDKPITSAMFNSRLRKTLSVNDPKDIEAVLPRFIEWCFTGGYPGYSWSDFVRKWHGQIGPVFTSYEAVTEDPRRELVRVLEHFGRADLSSQKIDDAVAAFSFQNQTNGRKPGEEDIHSFVRKGIVGDWKNVFNRESKEIFNHYAGPELKLLGYELDDEWVS